MAHRGLALGYVCIGLGNSALVVALVSAGTGPSHKHHRESGLDSAGLVYFRLIKVSSKTFLYHQQNFKLTPRPP